MLTVSVVCALLAATGLVLSVAFLTRNPWWGVLVASVMFGYVAFVASTSEGE